MSYNVHVPENKMYAVCDNEDHQTDDLFRTCLINNCSGNLQDSGSYVDPISGEVLQGRVVKPNRNGSLHCYNDQKESDGVTPNSRNPLRAYRHWTIHNPTNPMIRDTVSRDDFPDDWVDEASWRCTIVGETGAYYFVLKVLQGQRVWTEALVAEAEATWLTQEGVSVYAWSTLYYFTRLKSDHSSNRVKVLKAIHSNTLKALIAIGSTTSYDYEYAVECFQTYVLSYNSHPHRGDD